MPPTAWTRELTFALNGTKVVLQEGSVGQLRLVDYIRNVARLTGTKVACGEGGCGACTVVLRHQSVTSSQLVTRAVNACLMPLAAVDGMEVLTVEGVGSTKTGLHQVQKTLVEKSGMQCGYCTPGWVMNMVELLQTNESPTQAAIEDHFDGNLCRCTGYRPILATMHSFGSKSLAYEDENDDAYSGEDDYEFLDPACDRSESTRAAKGCNTSCADCPHKANSNGVLDMEDLRPDVTFDRASQAPPPPFIADYTPVPLCFADGDRTWYRVLTLEQLAEVHTLHPKQDVMLVGGLTSRGVAKYLNSSAPYRHVEFSPVLVDITHVPALKTMSVLENSVVVGAAVTLNELLLKLSIVDSDPLHVLAMHIRRIANNQVRNAATWAGNLALARTYPSFPSDLVVGLAGIGATLDAQVNGAIQTLSVLEYLALPKQDTIVLVAMTLPILAHPVTFLCHKVAQRAVNAHSHVNGAVLLVTNGDHVVQRATVVFGTAVGRVVQCTETQAFVRDKVLSEDHLHASLSILLKDTAAHRDSFEASVLQAFWYKSWLHALPTLSSKTLASAVPEMPRAVSSGTQSFPVHKSTAPVGEPIPKLASKLLATGEARFVADLAPPPGMLYGAYVYATKALQRVVHIDAGPALAIPGVVDVVTADDVPGENATGDGNEPLFVPTRGPALYVGAPLGLVVATSASIAQHAAACVRVTYAPLVNDPFWKVDAPVITVAQARAAQTLVRPTPATPNPIQMSGSDDNIAQKLERAPHILSGSVDMGSQRHMYMEPQATSAHPGEDDAMVLHASCQNPSFVQKRVALLLNVPQHAVTIEMKRAGGGFGGKLSRNILNAGAAAVAASKLGVPVQVVNDRNTDFQMIAGREAMVGEYTVGFDDAGRITALDVQLHCALGGYAGDNMGDITMAVMWADGAYFIPHMRCEAYLYMTNTPTCTSVRAPGVPNTTLLLEIVVHHIAATLQKPVGWIQARNMLHDGLTTPYGQVLSNVTLPRIWDRLRDSADVLRRKEKVAYFNANNRWKKKGLSMTPVKYGMGISGLKYGASVSIFSGDGTVLVTHGGCEIGQGIDTKAAQMAAYALGLPLHMVRVRATSTDLVPNSDATGGSSTSESIARSVRAACKTLNARLAPIRAAHPDVQDWAALVALAHDEGVHLAASAQPRTTSNETFDYFVYAAAASEVEVDVLTGEVSLVRTDIMYDCGVSLNPAIDIGQIEGALVMALGFFFQEEVLYDPHGVLLSSGTWEYKIPSTKDIPQQLHVTLLDKSENEQGIMSSKAVGEPPFQLANSIYFAIKDAIAHSRDERGLHEFFQLDLPATVKRRQQAANVTPATDYRV
ncbi:hypothetical protein SPRG_14003 [Saprolegnia parasitica CBS 223.65]|uniref:2Fe-2S ferredoxin-type domain-containing protein n=1 Tax=Saprolegnia parasitica (strain CBS 223.65) TaxID=695850 RepID=A0A067BUG2_SAPPC|nr:hypothetical protein SPRG_14003 [Saprolegnia parasitica CBS 223.65]KDO20485.1 hypothetical protein SPRG_14003 [Saprolegnia parasitica CBS 223.65]|eukprot:XP_012208811.1 hypothetical protein SPRG_14003 [Saprolegnia parasitica CBS 223.65]